LDELVGLAVDCQGAAGLDIDLDAVAIVDDVQRRGFIIENQSRKGPAVNVVRADIDGRLHLAGATGRILRVQVRPVRRATLTGIGPMVGISVRGRMARCDGSQASNTGAKSFHHASGLAAGVAFPIGSSPHAGPPCNGHEGSASVSDR